MRLFGGWALSLAACLAIGVLLLDIGQGSARLGIGRAEAVVARACDLIGRYGFYTAGWPGPAADGTGTRFQARLGPILARPHPGQDWRPPTRHADGGGSDRIGAWPEGIFGTQLGLNRNGRPW